MQPTQKTLRLVLGDQLNEKHPWFEAVDKKITYVMMEVRQETDYAKHHIQKIVAFFAAMRVSFDKTVEAVKDFARMDAARFHLRDSLRSQALA